MGNVNPKKPATTIGILASGRYRGKCRQCGSHLKSDGSDGQAYCLNGCVVDNPKDKPKREKRGQE